jgi:hypothetical protein
VRRQATGNLIEEKSQWMWITTLTQAQVPTEMLVHLGHARWDIENYGFNELVNAWHADHLYKHHPRAIEAFCLVAFLAYNLFHAFLTLNVKAPLRRAHPECFWARVLAVEIYQEALDSRARRPP